HQPHRPTLHPHVRMVRAHRFLQASGRQLRAAPSPVLRRLHVRRQAPCPSRRARLSGEARRLMRSILTALVLAAGAPAIAIGQAPVDSSLAALIATVRAVDNHTHVNTVVARDSESDALPLDGLPPFALPARLSPDNPELLEGYRTLYDYRYDDLREPHVAELRASMQRVAREQGERFPEWVLDRIGVEVMLANRIAMGPGLASPRFRWVSYVDALMLPLSTAREREATPDYRVLYPLEERLLRRYLADLHLAKLPPTLD